MNVVRYFPYFARSLEARPPAHPPIRLRRPVHNDGAAARLARPAAPGRAAGATQTEATARQVVKKLIAGSGACNVHDQRFMLPRQKLDELEEARDCKELWDVMQQALARTFCFCPARSRFRPVLTSLDRSWAWRV